MIKKVSIKGIHGVNGEFPLSGNVKVCGESKLGKTTLINVIAAAYSDYFPGYAKTLPEGSAEIETDSGQIVIAGKKALGNPITDESKKEVVRHIIPGNFYFLSKSTGEQRTLIAKVLGINVEDFNKIVADIKDIKSKQKMDSQMKDKLSTECIELEAEIESLSSLSEPTKVDYAADNSAEILEAFGNYVMKISQENSQKTARNTLVDDDKRAEANNITSYYSPKISSTERMIRENEEKLRSLSMQADAIKQESAACPTCGASLSQEHKDTELASIRKEYVEVNNATVKLKESLNTLSLEYKKATEEFEAKEFKYEELQPIPSLYTIEDKAQFLNMEYKRADNSQYEIYQQALKEFHEATSRKQTLQEQLLKKQEEIKKYSSSDLDMELKKLEKKKKDFEKNLDAEVKKTGLNIELFKTQKNGEVVETFEIYDEDGFEYKTTSTGNRIYMDVLISKLFIDFIGLDFILIDRWESVGGNLREKILKHLGKIQIIATEVSSEKEITIKPL